ncbi:MAG TPA: hypothetical protein DHK64_13945, partial [Rhodobiaceae bacterium]|nr:hypothetical protein [Rhodobiaceae bacterium]
MGDARCGRAGGHLRGNSAVATDRSGDLSYRGGRSEMNNTEFDYLKQVLYDRAGLVVTPEKGYLIESRLAPLAR